jgi:8-oxo-dGTP pyrophosphatase MutT (NUDIX family)
MPRIASIAEKLAAAAKADVAPSGEAFDPAHPRAAVAAILRERDPAVGAELFFIRRAEHPGDPWSGHIAFPGGRREADDATLLETAARETREEVGLDLGRAELLARLPDLPAMGRTRRTNLVVTPFVFALREEQTVTANDEVAETLWVPLARLLAGEGRGTYTYAWDGKSWDLPCFRLEILGERGDAIASPQEPRRETVLWGMTLRMLETMFEALAAADGLAQRAG